MKIETRIEGDKMTVAVDDRLDSATAPRLAERLTAIPDEVKDFVFDFASLRYISSAGIRIVLKVQQTMAARGGKLSINAANRQVKDVFQITGLADYMDFEN